MIKKIFVIILFIISIVWGQQSDFGPISGKPIKNYKLVKINMHYINPPKSNVGFTPTHDNYTTTGYSGYDHALDIINSLNYFKYRVNEPLHLPDSQTLAHQPKQVEFVLDAVYFWEHQEYSTMKFIYSPSIINIAIEGDSVINCFFPLYNALVSTSGYATMSITGTNPYNLDANSWQDYIEYRAGVRSLWDGFVPFTQTLAHELGHCLGLNHTVELASCLANSVDDVHDTPSAYDMYQSYNKFPGAQPSNVCPRCAWGTANLPDCSNNQMDYTNGIALSPGQIQRIHIALEGGTYNGNSDPFIKRYTVCESIKQNKHYCDMPYHKFSFYGKEVKIGGCLDSPYEIIIERKGAAKKIYFAESVDFLQAVDFKNSTLLFEMKSFFPETDPILDVLFADCSVNF